MVKKICWNCRQKGHEWWGCTEPIDKRNFALSRKIFAARDRWARARRNYKAEAFYTRHPELPRPSNYIQRNTKGQQNPVLDATNQLQNDGAENVQIGAIETGIPNLDHHAAILNKMATSSFHEGGGETQVTITFSDDASGSDSDSSSSSTSTLEADYPGLKDLMDRISIKEDPKAVIIAEQKQLDKKIDKFRVKKQKYYREMEELEKMVTELAEQEKKLKEKHEALASIKTARLSEARKKVTELESEISELKGKIEDVNAESREYNENHKAIMEEISHTLMRDEPLIFRVEGISMIGYANFCDIIMGIKYSQL